MCWMRRELRGRAGGAAREDGCKIEGKENVKQTERKIPQVRTQLRRNERQIRVHSARRLEIKYYATAGGKEVGRQEDISLGDERNV